MKKLFLCFLVLFPTLSVASTKLAEPATLYRVEEGVFTLKENQTIDLTDRYLLLALRQNVTRKKCLGITINGLTQCIELGKRYNLKAYGGPFSLSGELFSDKKRCFLDIVKINAPQGAIPSVTFRLHCI